MSENTSEVKKVKKLKPNIIDLLIVVAVIAAIVGIAFRKGDGNEVIESHLAKKDSGYAELTFVVADVNKDSYDAFSEGDEFKANNFGGCSAGVLQEISEAEAAVSYVSAEDGSIVRVTAPLKDANDLSSFDRVGFSGVLKSEGTYDDEGYFMLDGKHPVMPGSELVLADRDVIVTVTVVGVAKAD